MSLVYQADTPVGGRRPGLYLGGKSDAKNRAKLEQWQVTHILNVTPPVQYSIKAGVANYFESSGAFCYKRVVVLDSATSAAELLERADEMVDFIAAGLCRGSVLVHCKRGSSRSPTAVLFFLLKRVGMTVEQAMALIKRRRPNVEPIPSFLRVLETYESRCRASGAIQAGNGEAGVKRKAGPSLPSQGEKRPRRVMGPSLPSQRVEESKNEAAKTGRESGGC